MAPKPRIPPELKLRPFSVAEARAAGVSPTSLRGKSWVRCSNGLYAWRGLGEDPWLVLQAWQRMFPNSVFGGSSAAWIYGMLDAFLPIEVYMPPPSGVRSRHALIVHRSNVHALEVTVVRGVRVTKPLRTLSDLCRRHTGLDALVLIDSALRLRLTDKASLAKVSSPTLCALAPLAEPDESPMETRLRWLLFQAGLPRPEVQTNLQDSEGRFVGRADLYYPQARLVIEFDGNRHRERLVEDNRRQNLLVNAGFALLRFTSADLRERPDTVAAQVRRALSGAAAASARPPAAARR